VPLRPTTDLLREAEELFAGGLALLAEQRWDDLPQLKKKKVALAAEFRQQRWPRETADVLSDLEQRSRRRLREIMHLNAQRILALQELQIYCMACESVSLRASAVLP
jgi:hypothetical protein